MASKSKIQWTNATWSPVVGCTKVSPGCLNCYAERMANRQACMGRHKYIEVVNHRFVFDGGMREIVGGWNNQIYCDEKSLEIPLHWRQPRMIFICSMSDLFHKSVPFEFIDKVMETIHSARQHTYQILTKRPERMLRYFNKPARGCYLRLENIWLGVTVCNQKEADEKIPALLQLKVMYPNIIIFVSLEPMLGAIDFKFHLGLAKNHDDLRGLLDWVIVGGESGPGARPMHPDWARDIRDQCVAADVPFFFKQWGVWLEGSLHDYHLGNSTIEPTRKKSMILFPNGETRRWTCPPWFPLGEVEEQGGVTVTRVGKKKAGRLLDGREWSEYPKGG